MPSVTRCNDQAVCHRSRGDQDILGADWQALLGKVGANIAGEYSLSLAEGKDLDPRQQLAFDPSP